MDTMPSPPYVSEKTRLKRQAKYLRKEISRTKALLKQQSTVMNLEIELADLRQQAKLRSSER